MKPKRSPLPFLTIAPVALILAACSSAQAHDEAFADLIASPPRTLADQCLNGLVEHRIGEWEKRDQPPGPASSGAFSSVEEIMRDVDPPSLLGLADKGCSTRYRYEFLSCTQVDWPENAHPAITPVGVSAESPAEMAAVMRRCMAQLQKAGLSPTGSR